MDRHRPRRPPSLALGAPLLALALVGCGGAQPGETPDVLVPAATDLTVLHDEGDGLPVEWTLSCDAPGGPQGDHPDPSGACEDLAAVPPGEDPFAPLPDDAVCTEQYGGPQTAAVTGSWRGGQVDATLDRTDGCGISRWDAVGRLLPGGGGVRDVDPGLDPGIAPGPAPDLDPGTPGAPTGAGGPEAPVASPS